MSLLRRNWGTLSGPFVVSCESAADGTVGADSNQYPDPCGSEVRLLRSQMTRLTVNRRMRRLQLRRHMSTQSQTETSTVPSLTSGSMDSYVSHQSSTDATSDDAYRWRDLADSETLSPGEMDSDGGTERQDSDPFSRLSSINTEKGGGQTKSGGGKKQDEGSEDEVVTYDSPSSEGEVRTPVR